MTGPIAMINDIGTAHIGRIMITRAIVVGAWGHISYLKRDPVRLVDEFCQLSVMHTENDYTHIIRNS